MSEQKKQMSGPELVKRILSGERDLKGIVLTPGFILSRDNGLGEINDYAIKNTRSLHNRGIDLSGSEFEGIVAPELYLPYLIAENAIFRNCDFRRANFHGGDFYQANFQVSVLRGAELYEKSLAESQNGNFAGESEQEGHPSNFTQAHLSYTDMRFAFAYHCYFGGADFEGAKVSGLCLEGADLTNALNLEQAIGLGYANFDKTLVDIHNNSIIMEALSKRIRTIVK